MPKKKKLTNLILLCASHLDTVIRIKYIQDMIESWDKQTVPIQLHLSISVRPSLQSIYNIISKQWQSKYQDRLFLYPIDTRTEQFKHYKNLSEKIQGETWCMFTDDDDLHHPDRIKVYKNAIETHSNKTCLFTYHKSYHNESYVMDDVPKTKRISDTGGYWMHCCKLSALKDFCEKASDIVLEHYLCDVLFQRYLSSQKGRKITIDDVGTNWMYYHRGVMNPNARETSKNYVKNGYYDEMLKQDPWYSENYDIKRDYEPLATAMNNITYFITKYGVHGEIDEGVADNLYHLCMKDLSKLADIDRDTSKHIFKRFIHSKIIKEFIKAPHTVPTSRKSMKV